MGRLTRDPDIHKTDKTVIARFSLAVDRRFKTEGQPSADFISCVAFGKTAEFLEKYIKQGVKIALEGRIQTGSYEKDGVKHYTTDIVAESVEFAESKKASEENTQEPPAESNDFIEIPEGIENDLPFK
jgi:single-strand DNA-binding protein